MNPKAAVLGATSAAQDHALRVVNALFAAAGEFITAAVASFVLYGVLGWALVVALVIRISGAEHWISWIILGVLATAAHAFFTFPATVSFCVMSGVRAAVKKLQLGETVLEGIVSQIFGHRPDLAETPVEELDEDEVRAAAESAASEIRDRVSLLGRVRRFLLRRVIHRAVKYVLGAYMARVHKAILDGEDLTLRDVTAALARTIDDHLADHLASASKRTLTVIIAIEACVVLIAPLPLRWLPL